MNNGVLNITSLNLADIGMYQCVAENRHGRVFTNAELRVVGRFFFEKSCKLCRRHAAAFVSVWIESHHFTIFSTHDHIGRTFATHLCAIFFYIKKRSPSVLFFRNLGSFFDPVIYKETHQNTASMQSQR